MQYPIFVSVKDACRLLSLGKTSVYARLQDGSLKAVKIGRSTKITFTSLVEFSLRCLDGGQTPTDQDERVSDHGESASSRLAEQLVRLLCYTHCKSDEAPGDNIQSIDCSTFGSRKAGSLEKNFGGKS